VHYLFADFSLDTDRRELRRGDGLLRLEPKAFDLLVYLIANRERVVSKDDLLAAVWNGRIVSESALTTCINAVRKVIGDNGKAQRRIKTLQRKGFRFVADVREERNSRYAGVGEISLDASNPALTLPDKPSIAVLPFANLGGNPEQEYAADGIVQDIITELSRRNELFVIARNSSFQYKGKSVDVRLVGRELGVRYVLEGSVRRGGDRLRVSAQLVDAITGGHRWAEHYDRKLKDVFALQDEVVSTIATILTAHVKKAEVEWSRSKPPNSWLAYDYYLQAAETYNAFLSSFSVEDLHETQRLLRQSLAIDENYARSYAILARTLCTAWALPLDGDFLNRDVLDRAHELALAAVRLDANLPEAHGCVGCVFTHKMQPDAAIATFERAIELNPSFVDWAFGLALVFAGQSKRAIDVLATYRRLDPFHSPIASGYAGLAHYMLKQYEQALPMLTDCVARSPKFRSSHLWLAATYARLGREPEAQSEVAEVLRREPNYTIAGTARRLARFKHEKDDKHLFDGVRMAGVPE
jgi:adenylate cyclase